MRKEAYDIIYSIGEDCACSMYMNKTKIRKASGPFDWLTKAPFETRIDLICNDFKDFLNKEDMHPIEKNPNIPADENHDYYENKKTGFYFYHDFPVNTDLDKDLPPVQEKYNRRIQKFYKNIAQKKRVLLVWFSHTCVISKEELITAAEALEERFKKTCFFDGC